MLYCNWQLDEIIKDHHDLTTSPSNNVPWNIKNYQTNNGVWYKSIFHHLPKLADQDVMTVQPSMESSTFWFVDAGGVKCQKDMVANQLHISDCKTGSKKEYGKRFCQVQSNLHTNKESWAWKKYQLIHHQLLPKKGRHNRIRRIQKNFRHKNTRCSRLPFPASINCIELCKWTWFNKICRCDGKHFWISGWWCYRTDCISLCGQRLWRKTNQRISEK